MRSKKGEMKIVKDVKYSINIMNEELKNKYISPEIKYAFKASIESMERDVALKVEHNQYNVYFCPVCKGSIWQIRNESNYCFRCGQKLNWG